MIVSWFVSRGMRDESGLFCTNCNHAFSVDYSYFYKNFFDFLNGKNADKLVYCPYCGNSSIYPNTSIDLASENFYKFKEYIEG